MTIHILIFIKNIDSSMHWAFGPQENKSQKNLNKIPKTLVTIYPCRHVKEIVDVTFQFAHSHCVFISKMTLNIYSLNAI